MKSLWIKASAKCINVNGHIYEIFIWALFCNATSDRREFSFYNYVNLQINMVICKFVKGFYFVISHQIFINITQVIFILLDRFLNICIILNVLI